MAKLASAQKLVHAPALALLCLLAACGENGPEEGKAMSVFPDGPVTVAEGSWFTLYAHWAADYPGYLEPHAGLHECRTGDAAVVSTAAAGGTCGFTAETAGDATVTLAAGDSSATAEAHVVAAGFFPAVPAGWRAAAGDGGAFYAGGVTEDGLASSVRQVDPATGALGATIHSENTPEPVALALDESAAVLYVHTADALHAYAVPGHGLLWEMPLEGRAGSVLVSGDTLAVVATTDAATSGPMYLVDLAARSATDTLVVGGEGFHTVALAPDASRVYGVRNVSPTQREVVAVTLPALEVSQLLPGTLFGRNGLAVSPDGARLYVSSGGTLHDCPTAGGACRTRMSGDAGPLAISPDGTRLYLGLQNGFGVLDAASLEFVRTYISSGNRDLVMTRLGAGQAVTLP